MIHLTFVAICLGFYMIRITSLSITGNY